MASNDALVADIFERLARDEQSNSVVDAVLAALEGREAMDRLVAGGEQPARPEAARAGSDAVDPVDGVYLTGISACAFRGIGARATLPLEPGPGLTVVVGPNGSGKSSFAEALDVALTGDTHRFRSKVWRDGWRNVHHDQSACIEVAMHVPGHAGVTTLTRSWAGADFERSSSSLRTASGQDLPLTSLGWDRALAALPPICANGEIEALIETSPSKLHDRLGTVLGLDPLDGAIDLLKEHHATVKWQLDDRDRAHKVARSAVAAVSDARAVQLGEQLRKRQPSLEAIEALVSGAGDADPLIDALEALVALDPVDLTVVGDLAERQDRARRLFDELDTAENREANRTLGLLERALDAHAHHPGDRCLVCGTPGVLDDEWRQRTTGLCDDLRRRTEQLTMAGRVRQQAAEAIAELTEPPPLAEPGLAHLGVADLLDAWRAWHADATGSADHVEQGALDVEDRRAAVVAAARTELADRRVAWLHLIEPVSAYLAAARAAQPAEAVADALKKAVAWLDRTRREMRNERVEVVRDRAREVWVKLRQQSSIELRDFQFAGSGNRRHVTFDVVVDGTAGQALGVMSQGELNALALAVFLPRATQPESPFRFVVVDDPIQAMDPAKVEGLASVLEELAEERQVVVFTHDLRLVDAIEQLGIEATVLAVDRGPSSAVTVRRQRDTVTRLLDEAAALARDGEVPVDVARRVSPNLCRQALETALARRYRIAHLTAGDRPDDVETTLREARGLYELTALALFDTTAETSRVLGRLNNKWGRQAGDTFLELNESGHLGLASSGQVLDLVASTRCLLDQVAS